MKVQISPPPISSYTMYAAPLSLIAHEKKAYDWIFSNFNLLCCFKHDYEQLGIFYSPLEVRRYCPWIQYQSVKKEFFDFQNNDLIDFIESQVQNNTSIYLYVDHKFIKQSQFNSVHDLFVYGIDRKKDLVYAADTCKDGRYSHIEVSLQELVSAYNSDSTFKFSVRDTIELLSIIKDREYSFSFTQFKNELNDNLYSRCSDPRNDVKDAMLFGLEVYDRIIEHFVVVSQNGLPIDIRALHVLWEHKELMQSRISFLYTNGSLNYRAQNLIEQIKKLTHDALIIRNLAMKINYSGNYDGINKLSSLVTELKKSEKLFIGEVLDAII